MACFNLLAPLAIVQFIFMMPVQPVLVSFVLAASNSIAAFQRYGRSCTSNACEIWYWVFVSKICLTFHQQSLLLNHWNRLRRHIEIIYLDKFEFNIVNGMFKLAHYIQITILNKRITINVQKLIINKYTEIKLYVTYVKQNVFENV